MWDRKELKAKGKAAYRANRVTCIIAALLLMVATGAAGGSTATSSWNNVKDKIGNDDSITYDYDYDDSSYDSDVTIFDDSGSDTSGEDAGLVAAIVAVVLVIVVIATAFGLAIGAFLLNPLQVGCQKFFIDNATDPSTGLNKKTIGIAFSDNYMKIVGSMFTTSIFTFLWTLLLIFPGIYKSYCWRLVPYIVSEEPTLTGTEARELSAHMMDGSKWDAFVMDLSFWGWKILGAFTLGILNLIFTNPYQAATNAELYLTLSGRPSEMTAPEEFREEEPPEVEFEFDQEGMGE